MATPLQSYTPTTDREDLSPTLSVLAQRFHPFLDKVMNNSLAATNTTHEWVNSKLVSFKTELNGTITSGATTLTIDGTNDEGITVAKPQTGMLIKINDEVIRVGAVVANGSNWDLNSLTRGVGSTTAAAHTAADRVDVIARPKAEGNQPTDSLHELGAKDSNITQIFESFISLSGTVQSLNVVGNENTMAVQLERKMKELMKELERSVILGIQYQDASGDFRAMGGLDHYIPTANVIDKSSAALTTQVLDQYVRTILDLGGTPNMILCSEVQKAAFNALKIARVIEAQPQSSREINNLADIYVSEAGPLPLMTSYDVPDDTLYILDSSQIKVVPLQGRRFGIIDLSKVGDLDKKMINGEYTMEFRLPEVAYKIHNLATTGI